ncbi:AraC family transcriptional regulator [Aminipila luticellarii]|uniref:AraC family transcriptional regulator n=1 Tax=Aminipila luticellarii TaxID=2507160 RepID=A0A410PWS7_9FIRM|nr:AraC family transcriptional regulator [Aminipila luticellarii]QAT43398.1 AraC family transcriptional regulator [Aminipila luticellarii]
MKNFVIPNLDKPNGETLSEYLNSSMEAFSHITGISVTYFNNKNEIVKEFKAEDKICNFFDVYKQCSGPCRKNLTSSGQFASRLGEPYIFLCKSGLTNIAISLIIDGVFVGYFIAGPMIMGEFRNSTASRFSLLNDLNDLSLSTVKAFVNKMKVYHPNQVSQVALLFYNCIITAVSDKNDYNALRTQYGQQNQINTVIQKYKKTLNPMEYPYDLENILITNVTNGQIQTAKENLRELLNKFSILEVGDLEGIKAKSLWLFAIIMRIANENEKNISSVLDTDLDVINKLSEAASFTELLNISENLIELITRNMLSSIYNGHSQIIVKALQFINKHYKEKITLKDIEQNLHVNASYFSTLFKHEMGVTFTDYLNELKIEHASDLLSTTNLSIIDISLSAGFDDQSYFTKVFKKAKGVTPKQYRSANSAVKIPTN